MLSVEVVGQKPQGKEFTPPPPPPPPFPRVGLGLREGGKLRLGTK